MSSSTGQSESSCGKKAISFHSLTPTNDVDLSGYEEAFDHVFNNDDVKNIAISGSYGAGKSSVLRTYEKAHPEYRFKYITLSYFTPTTDKATQHAPSDSTDSEKKDLPETWQPDLERKIVNQLIHQVDPEAIPLSNFAIKRELSRQSVVLRTVAILYVLLFSLFLIFPEWFLERFFILFPWLAGNFSLLLELFQEKIPAIFPWLFEKIILVFPTVLLTSYLAIVGTGIYQMLRKRSFFFALNKISIQGAEVELGEKSKHAGCSYFDQHLPDVVYLFEHCGADVIVFEDLDRFDANYIFKRLRELNTSVNNTRMLSSSNNSPKKPLRFLYLLRDDIFISKDRTKFFDFIIPIVPVIAPNNSYAQFLKKEKEGVLPEGIEKSFLEDLSLYIDDMRLFKNILNEFNTYHTRLCTSKLKLKSDKLLGLIVYKNIFPKDFSMLQFGHGFINHIFSLKNDLAAHASKRIREEQDALQKTLEKSNSEHLDHIYELNILYCNPMKYIINEQEKLHNDTIDMQSITIAAKKIDLTTMEGNKQFAMLIEESPNSFESIAIARKRYGGNHTINMSEMISEMGKNTDYKRRRQDIEHKNAAKRIELERKMAALKGKETSYYQNQIASLLKDYAGNADIDPLSANTPKEFEDITKSPYFPLVKFLLRQGHIEETYSDYTTYFYESNMRIEDQQFLRSVKDNTPLDWGHPLSCPEVVVSKIHVGEFARKEVLSFTLLDYLLSEKAMPEYKEKFAALLSTIIEKVDFLIGYYLRGVCIPAFIKHLSAANPKQWKSLLVDNTIGESVKTGYLLHSLTYTPADILIKMNSDNELATWLENRSDFFASIADDYARLVPDAATIATTLETLNVKFAQLDYHIASKELFQAIYEKNLYAVTLENIILILKRIYGILDEGDYYKKNLSMIRVLPDQPLCSYIAANMGMYAKKLLTSEAVLAEGIYDSEEHALFFLNHEDIEQEDKTRYAELLRTEISDLRLVENAVTEIEEEKHIRPLWKSLLHSQCIARTPSNVLAYFYESGFGFDEVLTGFINTFDTKILAFPQNIFTKDMDISPFFISLTKAVEIKDVLYRKAISSFNGRYYLKFNIIDIQISKISILIEENAIKIHSIKSRDDALENNKNTITFMREHYPDNMQELSVKNIATYLETLKQNTDLVDEVEILALQDSRLSEDQKLELIQLLEGGISLQGYQFVPKVKAYILDNAFDSADLGFIAASYGEESSEIQGRIIEKCAMHATELSQLNQSLDISLLRKLYALDTISEDDKASLLANSMAALKKGDVTSLLSRLSQAGEWLKLFERKQAKLAPLKGHERLLQAFQQKKWVENYTYDATENMYKAKGTKKAFAE